MYDYGNNYSNYDATSGIFDGILETLSSIMPIMSIIGIIGIISQWIIYKKAGKKGWESIVPIYNTIVLLQIVELPMWYIILYFIPIANIYVTFKVYIELAHKFGKSTGFGVATFFFNFVCLPILAFDKKCLYNGSNIQQNTQNQTRNNGMNLNPINQQDIQMINQNINPQINPVQQPITFEQNIQSTMNNQQPTLNVIPNMEPQAPQQVEPTLVNNQVSPVMQQTTTFNANVQMPMNNQQPEINSIPPTNIIPQQISPIYTNNQMNQQQQTFNENTTQYIQNPNNIQNPGVQQQQNIPGQNPMNSQNM